VVNLEELFAIHRHPVTRCLVVRGCWNSAGIIDLASKASVRRASVRTLPVSESSISASLEVVFEVLLKEMSRDSEVTEKLLILAMNDLRKHPPGYAYFRRIYATSSIVRRPPLGPPLRPCPAGWPARPVRPGRAYSVHWDTRRVVLALSGE
jgi:hypothetical protein